VGHTLTHPHGQRPRPHCNYNGPAPSIYHRGSSGVRYVGRAPSTSGCCRIRRSLRSLPGPLRPAADARFGPDATVGPAAARRSDAASADARVAHGVTGQRAGSGVRVAAAG
jgi:hypothetical protein